MEGMIAQIATTVIVVLLVVAPAAYALGKRKLKEVIRCLQAVDKALEDDKVTKEEVKGIWQVCKVLWEL